MRDMDILTIHLITIFVKMLRPGGVRAVAAESLLMKQQLLVVNRPQDSLWSVDLFRVESILLRSHWVMLVMDVFRRRLVGFGVEPADTAGVSLSIANFVHSTRPTASRYGKPPCLPA